VEVFDFRIGLHFGENYMQSRLNSVPQNYGRRFKRDLSEAHLVMRRERWSAQHPLLEMNAPPLEILRKNLQFRRGRLF
jgi:hypothetical protein